MRTNIDIDEKLVDRGLKITRLKTKKDLVNYALKELLKRKEMYKVLSLRGKISWEGNLEEMRKARKW